MTCPLTRAEVDAITRKFRTEIGGIYIFVAAAIEYQHRGAQ